MASIADMIKQASKDVGTSTEGQSSGTAAQEETSGIEIERQNIEHVQGQAKSGDCDGDSCKA